MEVVFVSALTSGVVALAIEWIAKPRLEARKERILNVYRARESFRTLLQAVLVNSTILMEAEATRRSYESNGIDVDRHIGADGLRAKEKFDTAIVEMFDKLADYAFSYLGLVNELIVDSVAIIRGLSMSSDAEVENVQKVSEIAGHLYDLLFARWWRPERYRSIYELQRITAD